MEGNKVMTRYELTATHTGRAFFGLKASGRQYRASGLGIDLIERGKFVESWGNWDLESIVAQMGIPKDAAELAPD